MTWRLLVAPQAEADLRDAFNWYEERSVGLGHAFLEQVENRFNLLITTPQLFRRRFGLFRLAPVERFPYAIYFILDEPRQRVAVLRVLHFKQSARPKLESS